MSIVVKKIGNKKYAYLAYRAGGRVVQKYLGSASDPAVRARRARHEELKRVPERFTGLFWDVDPGKLDTKQHARYIIERVLELGGLDAIEWIQRVYPTSLIIETCGASRKISPKSRNFWEIWFGVRRAH
jgi:hypothetical protein